MKITPIQVTIADLTKIIKTIEMMAYLVIMTVLRFVRYSSVIFVVVLSDSNYLCDIIIL